MIGFNQSEHNEIDDDHDGYVEKVEVGSEAVIDGDL